MSNPTQKQPAISIDDIWEMAVVMLDDDWARIYPAAVSANQAFQIKYDIRMVSTGPEAKEIFSRSYDFFLLRSTNAGIVRYGIPQSIMARLVKDLSSITFAIEGSTVLGNLPKMTKYLQKNYPEALIYVNRTLEVPEIASTLEGEYFFEIGALPGYSRALVKKYYSASPMTFGTAASVTTTATPAEKYRIASHYINSLMALAPPEVHNQIITNLKPFDIAGSIRFDRMSSEEYKVYRDMKVSPDRVMFCALMAATSFTKQGALPQHLNEWCKNRLGAMFAKAGKQPIGVPPEYQYEANILADLLGNRVSLRSALLTPVLSTANSNLNMSPLYSAVRSQVDLITQYYAMSTLRLAYAFMDLCETEAHTLKPVLNQGKTLMSQYDSLQAIQRTEHIAFHHYCVVYERPSWMETSAYPDIAYCARLKQIALGDKSWTNYKWSPTGTQVDKATLGAKTAVPLDTITQIIGTLDAEVEDYLSKKGKQSKPCGKP